MQRASKAISDEQARRVNEAVAAAEAGTSAEIVPVVASASGRYDRAEDIVGLWAALACLSVVWWLPPQPQTDPGSWGGFPAWGKLLTMLAAAAGAFVVGAAAAMRVGWLRRLFTPARQMREEVAGRARQVFYDQRIHRTAGGTGVCIFVSLHERWALVLADQAVVDSLGAGVLDELAGRLIAGLREGHVADALCSTIAAAGERLSQMLPHQADDKAELPDALVLLD